MMCSPRTRQRAMRYSCRLQVGRAAAGRLEQPETLVLLARLATLGLQAAQARLEIQAIQERLAELGVLAIPGPQGL